MIFTTVTVEKIKDIQQIVGKDNESLVRIHMIQFVLLTKLDKHVLLGCQLFLIVFSLLVHHVKSLLILHPFLLNLGSLDPPTFNLAG